MLMCKHCGVEKALSEMTLNKQCRDGREKLCKACRTIEINNRRREKKLRSIEYLGGKCSGCQGVFVPSVYDFHHIDTSQKEADPGSLMGCNWERIKRELDRCVLLCANCHRIVHANERRQ
jgi:predicted HNH restriction endonuclease